MAKAKKLNSTRVTLVVLSVFTLIFLIWALRSCNNSAEIAQYAMVQEAEARQNYLDSLQHAQDSIAALTAAQEEARFRAEALVRAETEPALGDSIVRRPNSQVIEKKITTLYVTFDGLNVRSGPGLNYGKVDRLKLYDEVEFLNEVTDSSFTINLGQVSPTEPWVKIKTPNDKTGWVFGAGVDYFKRKLEGVEN